MKASGITRDLWLILPRDSMPNPFKIGARPRNVMKRWSMMMKVLRLTICFIPLKCKKDKNKTIFKHIPILFYHLVLSKTASQKWINWSLCILKSSTHNWTRIWLKNIRKCILLNLVRNIEIFCWDISLPKELKKLYGSNSIILFKAKRCSLESNDYAINILFMTVQRYP